MPRFVRPFLLLPALVVLAAAGPLAAQAPTDTAAAPLNVVSANPFGLLFDVFNAEYERAITASTTVGIGGSRFPGWTEEDPGTTNVDVFWRFYTSGRPFDGWAFGAKTGYTSGKGVGVGFDLNRSWLTGADDNFYVGLGVGLKRILGTGSGELQFVPTFRIINVGFAF